VFKLKYYIECETSNKCLDVLVYEQEIQIYIYIHKCLTYIKHNFFIGSLRSTSTSTLFFFF